MFIIYFCSYTILYFFYFREFSRNSSMDFLTSRIQKRARKTKGEQNSLDIEGQKLFCSSLPPSPQNPLFWYLCISSTFRISSSSITMYFYLINTVIFSLPLTHWIVSWTSHSISSSFLLSIYLRGFFSFYPSDFSRFHLLSP